MIDIEKKINEIIEKDIKPILALHLGSVTYEGFKDGVVSIRFEGTCKGCPFSTLTLKAGVEEILKSKIEGVRKLWLFKCDELK